MGQSLLDKPCGRCGSTAWERLPRTTFLQRNVLPAFGRYPWRCALCNVTRYLPLRLDRRPARRD